MHILKFAFSSNLPPPPTRKISETCVQWFRRLNIRMKCRWATTCPYVIFMHFVQGARNKSSELCLVPRERRAELCKFAKNSNEIVAQVYSWNLTNMWYFHNFSVLPKASCPNIRQLIKLYYSGHVIVDTTSGLYIKCNRKLYSWVELFVIYCKTA
jgi:hypothetical protein